MSLNPLAGSSLAGGRANDSVLATSYRSMSPASILSNGRWISQLRLHRKGPGDVAAQGGDPALPLQRVETDHVILRVLNRGG